MSSYIHPQAVVYKFVVAVELTDEHGMPEAVYAVLPHPAAYVTLNTRCFASQKEAVQYVAETGFEPVVVKEQYNG
ncbi:MAG: hypothetical protein KatS3mg087_1783 [Patescibacteria group bacterium]|nr:MAG: hypothetical protein KatS3mg087_1783 [Patescibacteria group bacterium]